MTRSTNVPDSISTDALSSMCTGSRSHTVFINCNALYLEKPHPFNRYSIKIRGS
jgi:hypothetical protein